MTAYDPEEWSLLPQWEQRHLQSLVRRCDWFRLSVETILTRAKVPVTDARYSFVYRLVQQRWFNSCLGEE